MAKGSEVSRKIVPFHQDIETGRISVLILQWRNRLAHGTYMTVQLQSYAEVVSSSLTWRNISKQKAANLQIDCLKMWNASRFCVSSLRRGHANLLCIVPILVYVFRYGIHLN
jgi:hypothetical protein